MSAARFLALLFPMLTSLSLSAQPQRIVSLSLCSDELLVTLAEPSAISSVTWLAADTGFSPVADQVSAFYLNRGQAEEVLALDPDLILATSFSASDAVRLLKRLDHQVQVLPLPTSVEDSFALIRQAGRLLQQEQRAENLISKMTTDLDQSKQQLAMHTGKQALFLAPNGLTYGAGTLRDDFLSSLGWINVAKENGIIGTGYLPLEVMLGAEIDVIITTPARSLDGWLADKLRFHPAFRQVMNEAVHIELADMWFQCAGPSTVHAWQALAVQMSEMGETE